MVKSIVLDAHLKQISLRKCLIDRKILIFLCFWMTLPTFAQKEADSLDKFAPLALGLEEIMNLKVKERLDNEVSIASKKVLEIREAPGIVSVITKDEILKSGARDLIDVLSLIPGFYFCHDIAGVVGISTRGNWAHEGKMLLQINGISLNETLFATTFYGNRFPVEAIQRIEIIRGPGSAIYGGYAELGVINIITQSGEEINGLKTSLTYSQTAKGLDRANGFLSFGKRKDELNLAFFAYHGIGGRSQHMFEDFYGHRFRMDYHTSRLSPTMFYGSINYKNLEIKYFHENYHATNQIGFGKNLPRAFEIDFRTKALQSTYKVLISEKTWLISKIEVSHFVPYHSSSESAYRLDREKPEDYGGIYENTVSRRLLANTVLSYEPSDNSSILIGIESFEDKGDAKAEIDFLFQNGKKEVFYYNHAAFVQGLFRTKWFTLTAGGRIDYHNKFGDAFAPRFAITRIWKKVHAKILLSNAFRQPSIQNIDLNPDIKPEKTNVIELETGYLWNEKFSTKINFFDTKINNPIVYLVDEQGENYENYGKVASRGIELEATWKDPKWGYCKMNYSFYHSYENTVSLYAVPKKGIALSKDFSEGELLTSSSLLGISQHKTIVYGSLNITKNFSLNPSLCLLGRRYGFVGIDEEGTPFVRSFSPQLLIDFQVMKREFLIRDLTLSLGVRNLLDQQILYIQPYNGGSASLPGPSRSFMVRMMYNVPF